MLAPVRERTMRVLLIDDDARLAGLLRSYLGEHGVRVESAAAGREGLGRLEHEAFDAVLLDVMMPGLDGLEVMRRIRARSSVAVILLTARGDESDRVVGLELGADDYIPKPFGPRELLARLRAVLRRTQPALEAERLQLGAVEVDVPAREARVAGERIALTGLEFDLLVVLLRRAGRVVPREALLAEAGRGDVTVSERSVDVHISKLRKKLALGPQAGALIETIRGVGYMLRRAST